eukprot:1155727-Pelagomonas_calceolata.AAC.5
MAASGCPHSLSGKTFGPLAESGTVFVGWWQQMTQWKAGRHGNKHPRVRGLLRSAAHTGACKQTDAHTC